MALLKTNDAVPLFAVATMIIALVLSLYFVQGHGELFQGIVLVIFHGVVGLPTS
jgi:hypothetical protein